MSSTGTLLCLLARRLPTAKQKTSISSRRRSTALPWIRGRPRSSSLMKRTISKTPFWIIWRSCFWRCSHRSGPERFWRDSPCDQQTVQCFPCDQAQPVSRPDHIRYRHAGDQRQHSWLKRQPQLICGCLLEKQFAGTAAFKVTGTLTRSQNRYKIICLTGHHLICRTTICLHWLLWFYFVKPLKSNISPSIKVWHSFSDINVESFSFNSISVPLKVK